MPTPKAVHEDYLNLIEQFNKVRLVNDANRVPLLRQLLKALRHPDRHAHVIHIAGTNGKGSTGAMLAAILQAAGYRVGRFSSPAILDDREQLQINGQWITEAAFVATYRQIEPVVAILGVDVATISIFEWQFLISLVWFFRQSVDYIILEAGLGGLMDATNAISPPELTVLTKIAMDHTQVLGDSLAAIAFQKAQIIKRGTTVVTLTEQAPEALAVIKTRVQEQGVSLQLTRQQITVATTSETSMKVNVEESNQTWPPFRLNVLGDYQRQNLSLVLTVVDVLRSQQVSVSMAAMQRGLQHIQLPGRMMTISHQPQTIVDVAHNPDGMAALVSTLTNLLPSQPLIWILGVLADKALDEMLTNVLPKAQMVIAVTPANDERALPAAQLAKRVEALSPTTPVQVADTMKAALTQARAAAGNSGVVVVSGSFYVAKQVATLMKGREQNDW